MKRDTVAPTAVFALLAVLLPGSIAAQEREPLVTDRPDFTESTNIVGPGRLQIESGVTRTESQGATEHAAGELLLRIGLIRAAELRLGMNSYVWSRTDGGARAEGREDVSLGAKLHIAAGAERSVMPAMALILATSIPSGSRTFRSDELQPEAKLAFAWSPWERWALGANLNAAYLHDGTAHYAEPSASLTASRAVGARASTYFEIFGFTPTGGRADRLYANGGVTYLLSPDFQLDARVGRSLNGGSSHFLGIGLARRL